MFLIILDLSSRVSFLTRAQLTVPALHSIAGAFIPHEEYTPFQEQLQRVFAQPHLEVYCIDHMPGASALITFSRLPSPRCYTYKNRQVRVRPPDADEFSLFVQEVPLHKTPSSFTSDKRGYIV